ncbi:hypothetical protein C0992_004889 [Termitomyces sp. T32_za158]|nr:hypothetical protein C0992_004889 [Termitomyces sp. T32_za158]
MAVTYESAQTRRFQRGRTETIRSLSAEATAFVSAMVSSPRGSPAPTHTPTELRALFRAAAARHNTYGAWAADAQGVDRHMFGLKKSVRASEGESVPSFLSDDAFARSSHWELSTSQLSSPFFDGWGYGEVVPDGYGLSYAIGDDYIRWTITSIKRRTEAFKHYLAEAATEIRDMMEAAKKADVEQGQGKL